jgi:hypothetical protein
MAPPRPDAGAAASRGARSAGARVVEASGRTYGSPRIHADRAEGWRVGVNTVADSMRRPRLALLQVPTRNPTSG